MSGKRTNENSGGNVSFPSLYSFYTSGGIQCGLKAEGNRFKLNSKDFQIFSGSLHYFRILPERWEEAVRNMRKCNLNTVCTYVPWNLHEEVPGCFKFIGLLDLKAFLEIVRREDMFLILRPGPYICAELDFGGLPSWLLRDPNMKVRSSYPPFLEAVRRYFTELITLVLDFQFTVNGGPIIAVQIENEFGSFGDTRSHLGDCEYMTYLKNTLIGLGIKELLFTCDMPSLGLLAGSLDDVLMAACFQTEAEEELAILKKHQPDKPLLVAELWSGWFDHWNENHFVVPKDVYIKSLKTILELNASFNIYVFQGGTNFGFLNGANIGFPTPEQPYASTVTSYDYDALISEDGRCSEKYLATSEILKAVMLPYRRPETSVSFHRTYLKFDDIPVKKFLPMDEFLNLMKPRNCVVPEPIETLFGEECGVNFGFALYRTEFNQSGTIEFSITRGIRAVVFVNGEFLSVINAEKPRGIKLEHTSSEGEKSILSVLVENLGRVNFTENKEILNSERRGIDGSVKLNGKALENWQVYPLRFDSKFLLEADLLHWKDIETNFFRQRIGLYKAPLHLDCTGDTFIFSPSWTKGVVLINGFNIGRYWKVGPQQTLFVPKEILKRGLNEIICFELHSIIQSFQFKERPILDVIEACDISSVAT